jgi:phage terminase small subunit
MAELKNPRHEAFAVLYAKGQHSAAAAYRECYAKARQATSEANAARLLGNASVAERVRELQKIAADTVGPTVERIVKELERIALADIGDAVEWRSELVTEEDNPDGGDVLVIKHIFSNHVRIKGSDEIGPDVRAAIKAIEQTPNGGLKIRFHDKSWALKLLARYRRMIDPDTVHQVNIQQNNYAPVGRPQKESYDDFIIRRQRELGSPVQRLEIGVGAPAKASNGRDHRE